MTSGRNQKDSNQNMWRYKYETENKTARRSYKLVNWKPGKHSSGLHLYNSFLFFFFNESNFDWGILNRFYLKTEDSGSIQTFLPAFLIRWGIFTTHTPHFHLIAWNMIPVSVWRRNCLKSSHTSNKCRQ